MCGVGCWVVCGRRMCVGSCAVGVRCAVCGAWHREVCGMCAVGVRRVVLDGGW